MISQVYHAGRASDYGLVRWLDLSSVIGENMGSRKYTRRLHVQDFTISKDLLWMYGAYWAEMLARHLLGIEGMTPDAWFDAQRAAHFDIDHPGLNILFEVKLRANTQQIKLFVPQLEAQLDEVGFPQSAGCLLLFSYVNRNTTDGRQLFRRGAGSSWCELSAFLAGQLRRVYVVDLEILRRLARQSGGVRTMSIGKRQRKDGLRVNGRTFKELCCDLRGGLSALGMPSDELPRWLPPRADHVRPRVIETVFEGSDVTCEANFLVPLGLRRRIVHCLNGTIKSGRLLRSFRGVVRFEEAA